MIVVLDLSLTCIPEVCTKLWSCYVRFDLNNNKKLTQMHHITNLVSAHEMCASHNIYISYLCMEI